MMPNVVPTDQQYNELKRFVELLQVLMNAEGAGQQAEEAYNLIPTANKLDSLVAVIQEASCDQALREFAALLLRRLLLTNWQDIVTQLSAQRMNELKCNLLSNVQALCQTNPAWVTMRERYCDVICALAKNLLDSNSPWNEFLTFLFEAMDCNNNELKKCALNMFASLPSILAGQRDRNLDGVHRTLFKCLAAPENDASVKIAATHATVNFIVHNSSSKNVVKLFGDCSAPMIALFATLPDDDQCTEVGEKIVELAEEAPLSLRPAVESLAQACVGLIEQQTREPEVGHTALEIFVSLAESSPGMIKKRVGPYIKPMVMGILKMMADIDEDNDWETNTTEDDNEDTDQTVGESSLDRLAIALGGKAILPILMEQLPPMLCHADWKFRHAALMAFSCAGEGCQTHLTPLLDQVVTGILPYLADVVPRVRYAACNTLGQMATDFEPQFEFKFHSKIIPALLNVLTSDPNQRVQAHAGAAMVNFFEECPQEILVNYLDDITASIESVLKGKLQSGLMKGEKMVVEQLVVTLSAVADTAQEYFEKYYDKFLPCLKYIIQNTDVKELHLLRGKCIECVSLIGMAVGKEKFCNDANEIMKMLLQSQTGEMKLADDDPQLQYMITAWARLCRILGPDFEPYLPYVMGPVLKAAAHKVEMAVMGAEDRKVAEEEDWECVQIDSQRSFGIRTTGLEEKVTACSMLVCYARELKHAFVNYVEETAKILVPLLKFPFHEDIKQSAAECMPHLLESAKARGDQFVQQLWQYIWPEMLKAVQGEHDIAIANDIMDYLSQCIEKVGPSSLDNDRMAELMKFIDEKFKEHFTSADERIQKKKDEDYETDADEDNDDDEDEYRGHLTGLSDLLHSLFITYKDGFLAYFEAILPHIVRLGSEEKLHWTNHQVAICILDDVIEYTGQASIKYQEIYLPALASGIVRAEPGIRQAALYGMGQLAQHLGPTFQQFFESSMTNMLAVIRDQNSRSEENVVATENGISSLGKILRYCPSLSNHSEIVGIWLSQLPIWEDETEVPHVLEYLIMLIEQNSHIILGANSANLPHIVSVIADAFARSLIEDKNELGMRLVNFLRQVQANPATAVCLTQLSGAQQEAVKNVLSTS